ncbi:hypothetical protein, partial [Mycolicibacterium fortuitum]|uniref:hypothetical protein n=1 Tax=Mycolicibacterium fortuitum TaxID=1766 RepID=UPI00104235C1
MRISFDLGGKVFAEAVIRSGRAARQVGQSVGGLTIQMSSTGASLKLWTVCGMDVRYSALSPGS